LKHLKGTKGRPAHRLQLGPLGATRFGRGGKRKKESDQGDRPCEKGAENQAAPRGLIKKQGVDGREKSQEKGVRDHRK